MPAILRMDLTVPTGKSFLGCGTGNVFPVVGDHQIQWLPPERLTGSHPVALNSFISSAEVIMLSLNDG